MRVSAELPRELFQNCAKKTPALAGLRMQIQQRRRPAPDLSSFVVDSGLLSGAEPTQVKVRRKKVSQPTRLASTALTASASLPSLSASSPSYRRTRMSPSPSRLEDPAEQPASPQEMAWHAALSSPEMLAALTSPEEVARSRLAALTANLSEKLEAEQPLIPEELALLRRSIVEIRAPSWEEEREEERRAESRAAAAVEGAVGGEGDSPGAATAGAPKLPRINAADRKALRKMAAVAADAKEQHQQQQAAARAVGERGAPQPYSLVSTLSAHLLPRTPDGLTPVALKAMPGSDFDFVRAGQGPGPPAQRWLREVASEATLRLNPARKRVDHGDVLRPLHAALAVLRNACEAEDAARRREAIEVGRAEAAEFRHARERLSSSAKGGAMDWKRVEERAKLYAAAHSGLVPRVGLLDAQLGMAIEEVFGEYAHEMEIFPELTRRKAEQLAQAEARVAGLEVQAQRAEAEAAAARQQLATSESARSLIGVQLGSVVSGKG